jgi:flagellar hook-length control protein FliK
VSSSTSAYKKENQQYKPDDKVKSTDDSVTTSDKSDDKVTKPQDDSASKTDDYSDDYSKVVKESTDGSSTPAGDTVDADELSAVAEQIIQTIADIMNVSVDEIQQSMDELGMDVSDLLESDGVQQLVLNVQDASNIDMLVDESLGQYMTDISDSISQIIGDVQIPEAEIQPESVPELTPEIKEKTDDESRIVVREEKTDININGNVKGVDNGQADVTETTAESTDSADSTPVHAVETQSDTGETTGFTNSQAQSEQTSSGNQNQQNSSLDSSLVGNIAQALTEAVSQSGETSEFDGDVQAADIVRQVVDEIKANVSDKVRSLEIKLNPENLGRVQISVTTKNGVMQAKIIAENEAAKNAIEGSISLLKEAFNDQDLKVEAVEVTIASYDFFKEDNEPADNENKQKNTSSGGNDDSGNDDIVREELSDAEQLEKEIMQQTGNSVSYTV